MVVPERSRCCLLFRKHLLLALKILTAGRFAKSGIQVLQMVGLELLHLHIADVRNNEVLDRSQIGLIGSAVPTCACCTVWEATPSKTL